MTPSNLATGIVKSLLYAMIIGFALSLARRAALHSLPSEQLMYGYMSSNCAIWHSRLFERLSWNATFI